MSVHFCTFWYSHVRQPPCFSIIFWSQKPVLYASIYTVPTLTKVVVPCPLGNRMGTLFLAWSLFSVCPSFCARSWFLEVFSKTIRPIDFILGIHDLLGGTQNALAYCRYSDFVLIAGLWPVDYVSAFISASPHHIAFILELWTHLSHPQT